MNKSTTPDIVVVGSVAFDSVKTSKAAHEKLLGGSASYTSIAAALLPAPASSVSSAKIFPRPTWRFF